jgi:threonine/homoserine/homoserine lactone efflux protein
MTNPLLFLVAVLILLGTPGPTNTLLWASGVAVGIRRSLPLLLAELAGYLIAILLLLLILQPIVLTVPALERFLALAGGIYICFLAVTLWRQAGAVEASAAIIHPGKVFVVTLLNPKALVFAFTIIPVGHEWIHGYFMLLGLCILAAGFSWIVLGRLVGAASGKHRTFFLKRLSSATLGVFASFILLSAFTV